MRVYVCFLFLFFLCFPISAGAEPPWQVLEPGLEYAQLDTGEGDTFVVARINPAQWDVVAFSAENEDHGAISACDWLERHGLGAVINASMYLPDGRTSTGFLRGPGFVNQPRLNKQFGAFLVAGPSDSNLPHALVLDRNADDWERLLPFYSTVVQDFRLIDRNRKNLWPDSGKEHSIASVGQDTQGRLLFIHGRKPRTVHDFINVLLRLPLDLERAMYVEGGPEASLCVSAGGERQSVTGDAPLFSGNRPGKWRIPNIIGIRRPGMSLK